MNKKADDKWLIEALQDSKGALKAWNSKKLTDKEAVWALYVSLMQPYYERPVNRIIRKLGGTL